MTNPTTRAKTNELQTIGVAIFSALGTLTIFFIPTYCDPILHGVEYPLGYWTLLWAIPVFLLTLWLLKKRESELEKAKRDMESEVGKIKSWADKHEKIREHSRHIRRIATKKWGIRLVLTQYTNLFFLPNFLGFGTPPVLLFSSIWAITLFVGSYLYGHLVPRHEKYIVKSGLDPSVKIGFLKIRHDFYTSALFGASAIFASAFISSWMWIPGQIPKWATLTLEVEDLTHATWAFQIPMIVFMVGFVLFIIRPILKMMENLRMSVAEIR